MKGKEFNKKTIVLLLAPLLVALMVVGVIFSVRFNKDSVENDDTFVENVDYTYNKVYLLDNDNVLVPLTIKYETFDYQGEELMYLVNCLKENSEITNNNFKGLLNENVSVTSINLNEGSLTISFNDAFNEYDKDKELRIVESLIWTFTDLDYVDNVSFSINENICVDTITVFPFCLHSNKKSVTILAVITSSPFVGSSKIIISGSCTNDTASDAFCFIPVDNSPTLVYLKS
jgi:hypothetical protein